MKFYLVLLLFLPTLLVAQSFDDYMKWGVEALEIKDYDKASIFFEQARTSQPQNPLPDTYLEIIAGLTAMENMDSVKEVDQFLEEQEQARKEKESKVEESNPDLQKDFIYQQQQKDLARQQRPPLTLHFSLPLSIPKERPGDIESGNLLSRGYRLGGYFFPGFLNRSIGVGVSSSKKMIPREEQWFGVSNLYFNFQFRNYIAEELEARTILATSVGVGLSYLDEYEAGRFEMMPSWQVSVYLSDPLFYHLLDMEDWKSLVFNVNALVRYGESMNVIEGDAGLVYRFERFDFALVWDYTYQFKLYEDTFEFWSFSLMAGINL